MGTLEPEFYRLHWPPLVKSVRTTKEFPGYKYEFFETFQELDKHFTETVGADWQSQPWAKFWINQHKQTRNESIAEDRRLDSRLPVKKKKATGPRRDTAEIFQICKDYLSEHGITTSRKLSQYLATRGIKITHMTAWRIIKEINREQGL